MAYTQHSIKLSKHMDFYHFITLLRNEPLIEADPSVRSISKSLLESKGGAIYYGTGLTTPKAVSIGIPFDVLGMVLVAEKLRRALGLSLIIHHVADTHALANTFATKVMVDSLAEDVSNTMFRVAEHLDIPHFQVVLSSSFDELPEYKSILDKIHTPKGEYVQRELADIFWYRTKYSVVMKIGWIIQATEAPEGFDERLYDNEYVRLFGSEISFMYLKAGRTLDQKRPKASPYISVPGEQRILLRSDENVQKKFDHALALWPDKTLGGAISHLNAIVRLYERLVEPVGRGMLPEKIQKIIDRIFS